MRRPLGEYLVERRICTKGQIGEALNRQLLLKDKRENKLLGIILLETGFISEEQLIHSLSLQEREDDSLLDAPLTEEQGRHELLRENPIFSSLPEEHQDHLTDLGELAQTKTLPSKTLIFQKGDPGDAFYIIFKGSVKVFRINEEGAKVVLAYLGAGECFGEMALLTGEPRSASIETLGRTLLLVLEKSTFDEILGENPKVAQFLLKTLSQRLQYTDTQVEEESSREVALRHLLSKKEDQGPPELMGNSRTIKELRNNLEKLAQEETPVLISGEVGTEKGVAAQIIHNKSTLKDNIFLIMDCGNVPQIIPGEDDGNTPMNPLMLELSQATALFGHEPGYLSFAKTKRLGYLEAAKGGTLVINDIEKLVPSLQAKLVEFLQTGRFYRMGGSRSIVIDIRIIATTSIELAAETDKGQFNPELYALLSKRAISIPPLRLRKRDIASIVERLIQRQSQSMGKEIRGITSDALSLILQYDWPHNLEELEAVMRRAVAICDGNLLNPEQIFIGLVPFEGKGRFNLLKIPWVRRVMESGLYPKVIQLGAVFFFGLILIGAFSQRQYSGFNASLVLTWSIWWPLLVLSFPFLARFWCGICPLSTASVWLKEGTGGLNLKVPEWLKKYGPFLSILGFIGIIWAEQVYDMVHSPIATAYILCSILLGAIIGNIIFERRAWCRYLCPLGAMAGLYSIFSALEVRANSNLCTNECNKPDCFLGTQKGQGCPMFQPAFALTNNQNCILCGNCIKNCNHRSIRLNLRFPWLELLDPRNTPISLALFVPVLLGTIYAQLGSHLPSYSDLIQRYGDSKLAFFVILFSLILLTFGMFWLAGVLRASNDESTPTERFVKISLSLIPFVYTVALSYQIPMLFDGLRSILDLSTSLIITDMYLSLKFFPISYLQDLLILIGTIGSMAIWWLNMKETNNPKWHYSQLSYICLLAILTSISFVLTS